MMSKNICYMCRSCRGASGRQNRESYRGRRRSLPREFLGSSQDILRPGREIPYLDACLRYFVVSTFHIPLKTQGESITCRVINKIYAEENSHYQKGKGKSERGKNFERYHPPLTLAELRIKYTGAGEPFSISINRWTKPTTVRSFTQTSIFTGLFVLLCTAIHRCRKSYPAADQPERARSNLKRCRAEISLISTIPVPRQNPHFRLISKETDRPKNFVSKGKERKELSFWLARVQYPRSKFPINFIRQTVLADFWRSPSEEYPISRTGEGISKPKRGRKSPWIVRSCTCNERSERCFKESLAFLAPITNFFHEKFIYQNSFDDVLIASGKFLRFSFHSLCLCEIPGACYTIQSSETWSSPEHL